MEENAPQIVEGLIRYLKIRGQLEMLPEIIAELKRKAEILSPENTAYVTTAYTLGEDEKQLIRKQLENLFGRQLRLSVRIDPGIIGGMLIKVADRVIDLTLSKDLESLAKQLKD